MNRKLCLMMILGALALAGYGVTSTVPGHAG
jgi:hypothetical protein